MKNVHYIQLIKTLWKFWFIIFLPFIQGIFSKQLIFSFYNTIPIILVFLYSILEWKNFKYVFNKNKIIVEKGIVFKRIIYLTKKNISTVDIDYIPFLKFLNFAIVSIDTNSGNFKKSVIKFFINKNDIKLFTDYFYKGKINFKYQSKLYKIAIASSVFTRSSAGILILISIITTSRQILGEWFEETLIDTINIGQKILEKYLPPLFSALILILIIGWIINFLLLIFRQANFRISRKSNYLIIKKGLLVNRQTIINIKTINAKTIRQTPLMKIFGYYQMLIHTVGYGKEKGEMSILIPFEKKDVIEKFEKLLPELKSSEIKNNENRKIRFRYLIVPLIWLIIFISLYVGCLIIFKNQFWLISFIFLIPIFYFLIDCLMKINADKKVGISEDLLTMIHFKNLSLSKTTFSKEFPMKIEIFKRDSTYV